MEVAEVRGSRRRQRPDDDRGGAQPGQVAANRMAKPALDAMPDDGVADGSAHHDADENGPVVGTCERVHHQGSARPPSATAHGNAKIVGAPHPVRLGKHMGTPRQAARRVRPLRRRPARIARPARVRIRRRKPCVLLRRRLFGWNVRLLKGTNSHIQRLNRTGDRHRARRRRFDSTAYPQEQERTSPIPALWTCG